jgi:hypothetical protein
MAERVQRRNVIVGAITVTAIAVSFALALRARQNVDVPLIIVAPAGTLVRLDGDDPRILPSQPNTSSVLASYYFMTSGGEHDVLFQEPGGARREQSITVPSTRLPVIYTLLRDTLREMRNRSE